MAKCRVACVGYTNSWPLTRHIDPARFDVSGSVPSEAARKLKHGEADVGLIPVASLFSDGDYRVVPGLALGCDGNVASVLLVGETPLAEWDSVALDGESRTSVVLAQILLRGPLGRPDLKVYPVDAGTGAFHAQGRTGAVVIGDAARNLPDRLVTRIDLGGAWKAWTGLPFVFAVWAGRPDLEADAIAGLRESAEKGLPERAYAPEADRTYLTEHMRYALDDRALMGLRRFAALGRNAGFFTKEDVSLYPPPRRGRARVDVDGLLARGAAGERLTHDEAARLEAEAGLDDLGNAAHLRRVALHPGRAVGCSVACTLDVGGLARDALAGKLDALVQAGGGEARLHGGAALGVAGWESLLGWGKARFPTVALVLAPADVLQLAAASGLSLDQALDRLVAAGLDGVPADALDDAAVVRAAHRRGLRSSAALRFGAGETATDRIAHLLRLRDVQDAAVLAGNGGFTSLVCWTPAPDDDAPALRRDDTATHYLRTNAIARLLLDNVESLRASWATQGLGVAQAALYMGCDAFDSVLLDAGGTAANEEIERNIRAAGFVPTRRDGRDASAERGPTDAVGPGAAPSAVV